MRAATRCVIAAMLTLLVATEAFAQTSGRALAQLLTKGGYVLVMRHANSPQLVAQVDISNPDAPQAERRLDEKGRRDATAMGATMRQLRIPIATTQTSTALRAVETAEHLGVRAPTTAVELSDGGMNSSGITDAQVLWLRGRLGEKPATGNALFITHQPNFARAFPEWGSGIAQGEMAVFRPDGSGGATLIGRIRIDEWPALAPGFRP